LKVPVLSLRTGDQIALAVAPVINPKNLKIEGFYCEDDFDKKQLILLWQDVRESLPGGFVVDDHERLVEADELIRLKDVLDMRLELRGKPVETATKEKVGKVSDYAVETESMYIQKIYVTQSLLKSLTGSSLSIDRTQVIEVTPKSIIIQDTLEAVPAAATAVTPAA
jgi:sporulation protein YlmC with PRC-barrel domain